MTILTTALVQPVSHLDPKDLRVEAIERNVSLNKYTTLVWTGSSSLVVTHSVAKQYFPHPNNEGGDEHADVQIFKIECDICAGIRVDISSHFDDGDFICLQEAIEVAFCNKTVAIEYTHTSVTQFLQKQTVPVVEPLEPSYMTRHHPSNAGYAIDDNKVDLFVLFGIGVFVITLINAFF